MNESTPLPEMGLKRFLVEIETALIREALSQANDNHTHAARLLKVGRTSLVEKMKRFGMPVGRCPTCYCMKCKITREKRRQDEREREERAFALEARE